MKSFYVNIEWCTVCTIMMITITIINVKSFLKRHFWNPPKQFLKINLLLWKKAVLHTTTLRCTAKIDKFYAICLVLLTMEMAKKWYWWQELLNLTSKIWKPSYDWMIWCRQQSEDINYIVMDGKSLTWAYKLKALKSAWWWAAILHH